MTSPFDRDPLDELRHANPVDADRLPPASLARVRARIQEAVDVEQQQASPPHRFGWRVPGWAAGLGAAGFAAVLVASVVVGRDAPGATAGPSSDPRAALCVEQYGLDTLRNRSFAFDGTVLSISGDEVTFAVGESYIGSVGATVTLTATGLTGTTVTSAGGPDLTMGGRYLVAGDDRFVWACGFTQPYDARVAAQWKQATGN